MLGCRIRSQPRRAKVLKGAFQALKEGIQHRRIHESEHLGVQNKETLLGNPWIPVNMHTPGSMLSTSSSNKNLQSLVLLGTSQVTPN